jgi:hypothetical protein
MKKNVENGLEIIDIICDDFVSCFKVHQPIAADWYDNKGSLGRYYAIADADRKELKDATLRINRYLTYGDDNDVLSGIDSLMELFASGEYDIEIERTFRRHFELHYDFTYPETGYHIGVEYYQFEYYPSNFNYVFTQPYAAIDNSRVEYYMELIRQGKRPKAVVFQANFKDEGYYNDGSKWIRVYDSGYFIVDGHHKFLAYKELEISPEFVLIKKTSSGESEFEKHRDTLYFQIQNFLSDFAKNHIISFTTRVYTGNSDQEQKYNKQLDNYLSKTSELEIAVQMAFLKACSSNDNEHLNWLVKRLEVLQTRFEAGHKILLNFPLDKYGNWDIRECRTRKEFEEWCLAMFDTTLSEIQVN